MLRENQDRICAYFAVDFDLRVGTKLSAALDAVCQARAPARFLAGNGLACDFQWPDDRQHLYVSPTRVAVETLGLAPWLEHLDLHLDVISAALRALDVTVLNRIGFKVIAFLPLEMQQAEAIDLMFGAFLAGRELLAPILGTVVDPLVHVEAEQAGFKYNLDLTTVNAEQASQWFLRLPNLDKMVKDKTLDPGLRDFRDRIAKEDSFLFDVDAWQNKIAASDLKQFATSAFDFADELAGRCVRQLHAHPDSGFGRLVDAMLEERGLSGGHGVEFPPFQRSKPRS